jgi:uracil-DNA glycosylase
MIIQSLPADWKDLLSPEFDQPYFARLDQLIEQAYKSTNVFPPPDQLFNALHLCPFESVKVVIIGQDPYHSAGQAHGLCFSVNDGIKMPPSLKNIFTEMKNDLEGFDPPVSGNLSAWAKQGVLLLNAVLTVAESNPGSHKNFGWEKFTDAIIKLINSHKEHVAFLLWGNFAVSKKELINENKHLVLCAAHPSPLARGAFFGCRHFSQVNNYLQSKGIGPVNWSLG